MAIITKERAEGHLNAWYEADMAVSTGQSYKIGSRELRRANLKEIRDQIKYWENKVSQLEAGKRKRSRRIAGIIPRDF